MFGVGRAVHNWETLMWRFVWHRLGVDLHTWYTQMNNICDGDFSDGVRVTPRGDALTFVIDSDSSPLIDNVVKKARWLIKLEKERLLRSYGELAVREVRIAPLYLYPKIINWSENPYVVYTMVSLVLMDGQVMFMTRRIGLKEMGGHQVFPCTVCGINFHSMQDLIEHCQR